MVRLAADLRNLEADTRQAATELLAALRAHDPAAHAALLRQEAEAAGLRVLGVDAAETVASYLENPARVKGWMTTRYIAALRGHATEPTS